MVPAEAVGVGEGDAVVGVGEAVVGVGDGLAVVGVGDGLVVGAPAIEHGTATPLSSAVHVVGVGGT